MNYNGAQGLQVAMPMGGIGAGTICLTAFGALQDFSLRHVPDLSTLTETAGPRPGGFAMLRVLGSKPVTKVLEGPYPPEKIYNQGMHPGGNRQAGYEGFPRMEKSSFKAAYPYGEVTMSHPEVPLKVTLNAWSPLIPLDDKNSGLPAVMLEYKLENRGKKKVSFEFSYHLAHMAEGKNTGEKGTKSQAMGVNGVFFNNKEHKNSDESGSAAFCLAGFRPKIKAMWLRAPAWQSETMSALWKEISTGAFKENKGVPKGGLTGRHGGSLMVKTSLKSGASVTFPVIITWHFPNSNLRVDDPFKRGPEKKRKPSAPPAWRPYYASQFKDASEVAAYAEKNYLSLSSRTRAFQKALFASTLPESVLDAVSSNLAILKSPTLLRQENGNLWGWEGCFPKNGSCAGSCTHVYNYAQALPHLFPKLERTLREQELERSIDAKGHVAFRAALPDGPSAHHFHAAADGQCGGILKLYRDWLISGDSAWMGRLYPQAKRSLDYCIRTWDPKKQGVLVKPHHNTYDIEFWGANGMCSSIYVAALAALASMGKALGKYQEAASYEALRLKGAAFMETQLFNGEYFEQKVLTGGLNKKDFAKSLKEHAGGGSQALAVMKKEGPKYQYASGCISDGVIGSWMAKIYGLPAPLNEAKVKKSLRAIHRYNFRKDLSDHSNSQRPGYAWGHEAGLLVCSWPRGKKPTLPFIYSDEVWTGVEYQVASHLIEEGLVKEGLEIVKALRDRYDGRARNPFNEYECGSYYARAMASYALLNSLSGFRYSAVDQTLSVAPKLKKLPFTCFFSSASGFGTFTLTKDSLNIELCEGSLSLRKIHLNAKEIPCRLIAKAGIPLKIALN
jgi:uncharacterized protein (DUF608 family)